MKDKWTLTLVYSKLTKVGDDYETVETEESLAFHDFEDVMNMVGYRTDGAPGITRTFRLRYDREEE